MQGRGQGGSRWKRGESPALGRADADPGPGPRPSASSLSLTSDRAGAKPAGPP